MQKRFATAVTLIGLHDGAGRARRPLSSQRNSMPGFGRRAKNRRYCTSASPRGYRAGHIPGAVLAGPAESVEGLKTLKAAAMGTASQPRDRRVLRMLPMG